METKSIEITETEWETTGPEGNPRARLLAQIDVCGLPMHLEAYEVRNDPEMGQVIADNYFAAEWSGICALNTDSPFMTMEIGGREYVLIAQPHGD